MKLFKHYYLVVFNVTDSSNSYRELKYTSVKKWYKQDVAKNILSIESELLAQYGKARLTMIVKL